MAASSATTRSAYPMVRDSSAFASSRNRAGDAAQAASTADRSAEVPNGSATESAESAECVGAVEV